MSVPRAAFETSALVLSGVEAGGGTFAAHFNYGFMGEYEVKKKGLDYDSK